LPPQGALGTKTASSYPLPLLSPSNSKKKSVLPVKKSLAGRRNRPPFYL
jgi:hypothetical protein